MTISVQTLGKFDVRVRGRRIRCSGWGSPSAEMLCKILLTYRDEPVEKGWLQAQLWPELPTIASRQRLEWTVTQLQWLLNGAGETDEFVIQAGARTVCLRSDNLTIDGQRLLEATWLDPAADGAVAELERADELYCGPYLPDELNAPWSWAERERLEVAYETVLLKLADAYALRGKHHSAILVCQSTLIANPTCEAAAARLMAWTYQFGNNAQGLEVYGELCAWLDGEGRRRPTRALSLMADRLRQGLPLQHTELLRPSAVRLAQFTT
ncbi:MAG: bacterial transcriptional activator domain-containing protein [Anaerolineae bacterium]